MKLRPLNILASESREIEAQLLETGELTPELEIKRDENKSQVAVKLDHYCYAIKSMRHKVEDLKALKKQADEAIKRLEKSDDYLIAKIEATKDIHNLEGNDFKFSYRKSKRLVVLDPQKLPMDCVKVEIKPIADEVKKKIAEGTLTEDIAYLQEHESLGFKEKL